MTTSARLLQNPAALCNMVRRVAVAAGEIILEIQENGTLAPEKKRDGSPVSHADRMAEDHILKALKDILPEVPFIGEETDHRPDVTGHEYFWLVDPLDGTRDFLEGGEDYTVNIGLIRNGEPFLGVVYAPASGVLYAAHGPDTAVRWNQQTDKDKSIRVRNAPAAGLTVMASMRQPGGGKFDKFLEQFKVEKVLRRSSSLKLCLVAEGKADLFPCPGPTHSEWDTAAGDAVLRAAGGMITDFEGRPLVYKGVGDLRNPPFVASAFEWFAGEE